MDLLKLIVFEACEDGRVDNFDKADMLGFIEEAVKLKDRKEWDNTFHNAISVNKNENLRDDDFEYEYAIIVKIQDEKIKFDYRTYKYGIIENKNITKKAALQALIDKSGDGALYSFGHNGNDFRGADTMAEMLTKEWNKPLHDEYSRAKRIANLKNKCSIMTPKFKAACSKIIDKYK